MATRGPKPKPTALRVIEGNAGKRPLNRREPKPRVGLPQAPAFLSAAAKAEWRRVAPELHATGVLTLQDRAALAAYCQAYGRWRQAEKALSERDGEALLDETSNGNVVQHPLVGIANKAMADMVRYAAEFGMTPSARSRIDATPPADGAGDPAAEFL